jgi:hypothetical protein
MSTSTARISLSNYLLGNGLGQRQYIKNPSCLRNTTEGIVLGAGVSAGDVTRNTTTPITSISDFQIVLNSATNEYVEWTTDTIDRSDLNGNCQFSGSYKLSLGSGATVQAQVLLGGSASATLDLAAASTATRFSINVPCGDGSSATTVRFAQTVTTNTSTLNVADLYYGRALNIGSVAQASQIGSLSWAATTSCSWSTTQTTYAADFSNDTDCDDNARTVVGAIVDSSAGLRPEFQVTSMAPGNYQIVVTGHFTTYDNTNNNAGGCFVLHDGTSTVTASSCISSSHFTQPTANTGGAMGSITFNVVIATAGTKTFNIRAKSTNGGPSTMSVNGGNGLQFSVYRFPSSSEIAVRPEQAAVVSTLRYAATTGCQWQTTSATLAVFAADTDCPAPTVTGNATAPATKIPGVLFASLPAGKYLVQVQGRSGSAGATKAAAYVISDGTTNSGSTMAYSDAGPSAAGLGLSGIFTYATAQTNITFQVKGASYIGGGTSSLSNEAPEAGDFEISVIPLSQSLPAPILVGSVTSNSTGAERIERAIITGGTISQSCTSTPCTVFSQSGSWVSSVTRSATGSYVLNIVSGMFSAVPTCSAFSMRSADRSIGVDLTSGTPSSTQLTISSKDLAGTDADAIFGLHCQGPR